MNARILIALLVALTGSGCVDNNASLRISAACLPPPPTEEGSCVYTAKCEAVILDNLFVDATYGPTFGTLYWPFQVDNQRPPNENVDGALNTATAFITGYRISYVSNAVSIPDAIFDFTTQTVEAKGTSVLAIPVVPPSVALQLAQLGATATALVRAEIRATGHYGDDSSFETGPFSVVVEVLNGVGAGDCVDPALNLVAACPQPGQSAVLLCK